MGVCVKERLHIAWLLVKRSPLPQSAFLAVMDSSFSIQYPSGFMDELSPPKSSKIPRAPCASLFAIRTERVQKPRSYSTDTQAQRQRFYFVNLPATPESSPFFNPGAVVPHTLLGRTYTRHVNQPESA
jgi:hypothetical protein